MNISSVANLDGKTVVSQLQNFIILQMKIDILYLELVKTVYTKNPDLPHLGQWKYQVYPRGPPPGQVRSGMIFLFEIPYPRGQIIV